MNTIVKTSLVSLFLLGTSVTYNTPLKAGDDYPIKGLGMVAKEEYAKLSDKKVAIVRKAVKFLFDTCPGLKWQIDRSANQNLYLSELGNDLWVNELLNDFGWVSGVFIEWNGEEYVALGQGVEGKPSGIYAYGPNAQEFCKMETFPKGLMSEPMDVSSVFK